jgi:hypothetical protein
MRGSLLTAAAVSALFVACKSNDISSTTNSFLSQTIGASGGSFKDPANFEEITVPSGALSADLALQIGTLADGAYPALPMGVTKQGPVFAFKPYGTSFSVPATIYIPMPSGASGLAVYTVPSDSSGTWSPVGSQPINKPDAAGNARNFQ